VNAVMTESPRHERGADRHEAVLAPNVPSSVLGAAEVALAATSLALVYGFSRVFVDHSFFWRLAAFTVVSHALAAGIRRLGRGILMSALVSLVGLAVTTGLVLYASTTRFLLPTFATRDAARVDLDDAWQLFREIRTPVSVHPGFVLGACVAMWLVAFLADWAAFRIWSPFEALAPGAVVFIFCSLEAAPKERLTSTFAFAVCALLFILMHRALRVDRSASWLAAEPERGRRAVVRTGAAVALTAVVIGGIVGPALPGSGDDAAIAWRRFGKGDQADQARVTVSPLVTIRSRLVNLANVEAFTVVADQPDYWRLTSLDQFDGTTWTSSGEYQSAKGELPSQLPAGTTTQTVTQTVTIKALDPPWMPAAYEPVSVQSDGGTKAIYEAESATLTIGNKVATATDLTYVVQSRVPVRDVNVLRAATKAAVPAAINARYAVAPELTNYVKARARQAVGSATTPFDMALALQNYFRSPAFSYSLTVAAGQGVNSVEAFLKARVGYCEQYASAYAAMARYLGLPARVAVGFTPGEQDVNGVWHVRGEYAHAWPEVYLAGAGWVRFEPTPGRGAPSDQSYTGVPFQQTAAGDPTTATTVPVPTTIAGGTTATTVPDTTDPGAVTDPSLVEQGTAGLASTGGPSHLLRTLARAVLGLAAAVALALVSVPAAKALRRAGRRRQLRGTARGQVTMAWEDAVASLGLLRMTVSPAATPSEIAAAAAASAPDAVRLPLQTLAGITTEARYSAADPDVDTIARATSASATIRASVTHHVSWRRRIRGALDPRSLFPGATVTSR
jgi:transglutaminase-like putative cysteine protease